MGALVIVEVEVMVQGREQFEAAYESLLRLIRSKYPKAWILATVAPLLTGEDLPRAKNGIGNAIYKLTGPGDVKVGPFDLGPVQSSEGYGCDWHPSLATHQRMANELKTVLRSRLGW